MSRSVLVAGGGTAGHVFPAIAVARELVRLDPDLEPVFIGAPGRLEASLVPDAGFRLHLVPVEPIPRRPSVALLKAPFRLRAAIRRCDEIARDERAQAAVTFGGYVAFPVDRVAGTRDLPLVIHEQNAVPGLSNRVAARWADRVAVSFPGSVNRFRHPERCAVTGNPVREEMLVLDREARREAARERFGLDPDRPTLLLFGGSQGARSLNRAIVDAHDRWSIDDLQVLHAAGRALYREAAAAWERPRLARPGVKVRLLDFIDDMADAYAAADVVVCRAGATSIAELSVLGLPALLVPYPHATSDHQTENALALARTGAAAMVEDSELDGQRLVDTVEPWLTDRERHAAVATAASAFGRRDAATNVARLVLELIGRRPREGDAT